MGEGLVAGRGRWGGSGGEKKEEEAAAAGGGWGGGGGGGGGGDGDNGGGGGGGSGGGGGGGDSGDGGGGSRSGGGSGSKHGGGICHDSCDREAPGCMDQRHSAAPRSSDGQTEGEEGHAADDDVQCIGSEGERPRAISLRHWVVDGSGIGPCHELGGGLESHGHLQHASPTTTAASSAAGAGAAKGPPLASVLRGGRRLLRRARASTIEGGGVSSVGMGHVSIGVSDACGSRAAAGGGARRASPWAGNVPLAIGVVAIGAIHARVSVAITGAARVVVALAAAVDAGAVRGRGAGAIVGAAGGRSANAQLASNLLDKVRKDFRVHDGPDNHRRVLRGEDVIGGGAGVAVERRAPHQRVEAGVQHCPRRLGRFSRIHGEHQPVGLVALAIRVLVPAGSG